MLDPEYVARIDLEIEQSGGELAPDDHEGVWENLKFYDERCARLEFAIALLTSASIEEVLEMTLDEAASRYPWLARDEALKEELELRDRIDRAVHTRDLMDALGRMRRGRGVSEHDFDSEANSIDGPGGGETNPRSVTHVNWGNEDP